MLTVASYLWGKDHYSVEDVLLWKRMVDRHLTVPHETVCFTDDVDQFEGTGIRAEPVIGWLGQGKGMFHQITPFAPEAMRWLGERVLTMDLDCAIVGDMNPLVERDEDLVLWRNPSRRPWLNPEGKGQYRPLYNGSMMLVRTAPDWHVWRRLHEAVFDQWDSQSWVSMCAGPSCAYWDDADGVYRLEREDTPGSGLKPNEPLPVNARVIFTVGSEHKPHLPHIKAAYPFLAEARV